MRRREFIALLSGAALGFPFAVCARDKSPTIGFLGSLSEATGRRLRDAYVRRLVELGWVEGQNIRIEYRWADGSIERATEIADEFLHLNVDLIVTSGTAFVAATKRVTSTIPIVFASVGDPVGTGLVASLAHPGGNATGLSLLQTEVAGKRLDLMRQVVPNLRRLAVLANTDSAAAALDMRETEEAARTRGLETIMLKIRRTEDIAPAIAGVKGHAEALYVVTDPVVNTNEASIAALALEARLATMHMFRKPVEAGSLMSYGPSIFGMFRRSAEITDKILRGGNPAEIPVEQPSKFDLVINLTTAKALGLTVPYNLLALADEVIE